MVLLALTEDADMETESEYWARNQESPRYASFQASKLPIGSGALGSAVRRVVNLRMKGASIVWTGNATRSWRRRGDVPQPGTEACCVTALDHHALRSCILGTVDADVGEFDLGQVSFIGATGSSAVPAGVHVTTSIATHDKAAQVAAESGMSYVTGGVHRAATGSASVGAP